MLLQELFKEENKNLKAAYSIELNEESNSIEYSSPPENLEEIGFVLKLDDEGIEEGLMDLISSYTLNQVSILIEVPTQYIIEEKIDLKYLINVSSNLNFAFAVLPPKHPLVGDKVTSSQYKDVVLAIVDKILEHPKFDKFVYPVSNYFEYLMLEQVLGSEKLKNFRPESKYIQENFSTLMTKEESDSFKLAIKEKLYDFYGGKDGFELVAKTIIENVYEKNKQMYSEMVSDYVNNQNQNKAGE